MTEPPEIDLSEPGEAVTLGGEKPGKLELRMVIHPDPRLREKSIGLKEDDVMGEMKETTRMVAGAMIRSMYKYAGVGLAAQQVGYPGAMFVMDAQWPITGRHKPRIFINPNVREFGQGAIALSGGEGCLSTPYGFRSQVQRSETVTIEYRDLNWNLHEETFEGTDAIVIQHEIDHLHGNLFIDHLSRLKKDIFNRKVKKLRKRYSDGQKAAMKEIKQAAKIKNRMKKGKT
jgi:peptide deformylase